MDDRASMTSGLRALMATVPELHLEQCGGYQAGPLGKNLHQTVSYPVLGNNSIDARDLMGNVRSLPGGSYVAGWGQPCAVETGLVSKKTG